MKLARMPFSRQMGAFLHSLIPDDLVLPIPQGALKGKKWVVESGGLVYYLGSFETEKTRLFKNLIQKGNVVYDIGAHVGYFSLFLGELVGEAGRVLAFEPNPVNVEYLRQHLDMNGICNVDVFEFALSDENGESFFINKKDTSTGCLSSSGDMWVETYTVDYLVDSGTVPPPDYIKIDVEGAELLVLKGARRTLEKHMPSIFLATHGPDLKYDCMEFLETLGYCFRPESKKDQGLGKDFFAYPGKASEAVLC